MRRRRDVASAALIGLALCGSLAAVAAATPRGPGLTLTLGYTMWWGTQVGMWVWLTLAWSAVLVTGWALARLRGRRQGRERTAADRARRPAPAWSSGALRLAGGLAAVAAIAVVGAAVADTGKPDEHRSVYRPAAALASSLERAIGPGHSVDLIANLGYSTMVIKPALRYLLTRHGVRAMGRGSRARIGAWYELGENPFQYYVYVKDGVRSPQKGARLVARVRVVDERGVHPVTAWLVPHRSQSPRARARA